MISSNNFCSNITSTISLANPANLLKRAQEIITEEQVALELTKEALDNSFFKAMQLLVQTAGKIVLIGVGKSGIIAQKIAATFNSTGSTAVFLHGADAYHGDLGVVNSKDVAIIISFNGGTDEVLRNLPILKSLKVKIIALTSNPHSLLAEAADVVITIKIRREACQFNLAPSSSTTATLALGDALALILSEIKGFKIQNFGLYHPGGTIGRLLLKTVKELMHYLDDKDLLLTDSLVKEVVNQLNLQRLGAVVLIKDFATRQIAGIITDGNIRKALADSLSLENQTADKLMTSQPVIVHQDNLAIEALRLMEERSSQISVLPVVDDAQRVVGLIRVHDILGGKFKR